MKLSFMTFVCPDWDMKTIVAFARETDYDAVEIRIDTGHKHEVSSRSSSEDRKTVKKMFEDAGVEIACVAMGEEMARPDPDTHSENVRKAKANLDLAADLGAPVARIFAGGGIPELTADAADQVAAAFDELGDYAKGSGVCPMLECGHDIIKGAPEAAEVIKRVRTENFGALWNHSEMDDETFAVLKDHIRHFHVHKEVLDPDNANILDLAKRVTQINYSGYVSLEIIEKKNLPEDLLKETATRLKRYIAEAERG